MTLTPVPEITEKRIQVVIMKSPQKKGVITSALGQVRGNVGVWERRREARVSWVEE